jgi:hypothetical protein
VMIARALMEYSMICMISTRYRQALGQVRANYQILFEHAVGRPEFDLARATWMLRLGVAWAHLFLGDLGLSMEAFDQGMRSYRENGDYFAARTLEVYRGWLFVHAMDFEAVIEMHTRLVPETNLDTRAHERDRNVLLPVQHRASMVLAGLAYAGLGDTCHASALFAEAGRQMNDTPIMFDWYWRLALEWGSTEVALLTGDDKAARTHAALFVALALETEDRTWQALAWETQARQTLRSGDSAGALDNLEQGFAVVEGFETPLANWRLHRTAAAVYRARGETGPMREQQGLFETARKRLADSLPGSGRLGRRLHAVSIE